MSHQSGKSISHYDTNIYHCYQDERDYSLSQSNTIMPSHAVHPRWRTTWGYKTVSSTLRPKLVNLDKFRQVFNSQAFYSTWSLLYHLVRRIPHGRLSPGVISFQEQETEEKLQSKLKFMGHFRTIWARPPPTSRGRLFKSHLSLSDCYHAVGSLNSRYLFSLNLPCTFRCTWLFAECIWIERFQFLFDNDFLCLEIDR